MTRLHVDLDAVTLTETECATKCNGLCLATPEEAWAKLVDFRKRQLKHSKFWRDRSMKALREAQRGVKVAIDTYDQDREKLVLAQLGAVGGTNR